MVNELDYGKVMISNSVKFLKVPDPNIDFPKGKKILKAKVLADFDVSKVQDYDTARYLHYWALMYLKLRYGNNWDRILRYCLDCTPFRQYRELAELVYWFGECNSFADDKIDAVEIAVILGNIWKRTCGE